MAKRAIKQSNIPTTLPISSTCVAFLILDHFHAAGWVWGVVGTLYLIMWGGCIYNMCVEIQIDIIERIESTKGK